MKYFTFVLLTLFTPLTIACTCNEFDLSSNIERAKKVYYGKIINAQTIGSSNRMSATLKVTESYIGKVFDLEEVTTDNSSCSADLTINAEYLVFEDKNGHVNQCTMKRFFSHRVYLIEAIETLRDIKRAGI